MPVGGADQGIGLGAGDIMISLDSYYQNIQWKHDQIDDSEPFEHEGSLLTYVIMPKITIGLSDWWNITFEQNVGKRHMGWYRKEVSVHHREEHSLEDFDNAEGGIMGDSNVELKYLALNTGKGEGSRLFLGAGLTVPSKNQLTSSPYLKNDNNEYYPHRHFSISSGVSKFNAEIQYFYKRKLNPVFIGFIGAIREPVKSSKYGFSGSRELELFLSALFNNKNLIKTPLGVSLVAMYTGEAFWNDVPAPNTKSLIISPGFSIISSFRDFTISYNFQNPYFFGLVIPESGNDLNQETNSFQFSISVRKVLDYRIPWLYW